MYDIDDLPDYIELGHQNEKGVSAIEIDVTDWLTDYPTGAISITYIRPTETAVSPVSGVVSLASPTSGDLALTLVDDVNILTWTVTQAVTALAGTGSVVVHLAVGSDVDLRSSKAQTIVEDGHAAAGAAPTPVADWIADAALALAAIQGITFALNDGSLEVTI